MTTPAPTNRAERTNSPIVRGARVLPWLVGAVVLLVGGGAVRAQENLELYRRLAVELSREAGEPDGDEDLRRELAQRAADLDPSLGDPLVILARHLDGDQDAQRERERMLTRALSGEFVTVSRDEAVADMAELLLQQSRAQEALTLLDEELALSDDDASPLERLIGYVERDDGGATGPRAESLSRLERLYVAALLEGDSPWFAGRLLQRLRSRFPRDHVLGVTDWRRGTDVSLAVLEWIDARHHLAGAASTELYRELLRSDPPNSVFPALLDRYRRAGGEDPLVQSLAMLHGVDEPPELESFLSDKLIWELFFERRARSDLPQALQDAMEEVRRRDLVVLTRDHNRDGYWEERYSYRHGELVLWQLDEDQDGVASIVVNVNGPAVGIAVRREAPEEIILVDFAGYPLVSRVRWVEPAGGREWVPSQPVPFDVGISRVVDSELWNTLGRRVNVESDVYQRFRRQRRGDDSRALTANEFRDVRQDLEEWGLIE